MDDPLAQSIYNISRDKVAFSRIDLSHLRHLYDSISPYDNYEVRVKHTAEAIRSEYHEWFRQDVAQKLCPPDIQAFIGSVVQKVNAILDAKTSKKRVM